MLLVVTPVIRKVFLRAYARSPERLPAGQEEL
jgi:hypothetical protein